MDPLIAILINKTPLKNNLNNSQNTQKSLPLQIEANKGNLNFLKNENSQITSQATSQGNSQRNSQRNSQGTSQGNSQGNSQRNSQGTSQGKSQATSQANNLITFPTHTGGAEKSEPQPIPITGEHVMKVFVKILEIIDSRDSRGSRNKNN